MVNRLLIANSVDNTTIATGSRTEQANAAATRPTVGHTPVAIASADMNGDGKS